MPQNIFQISLAWCRGRFPAVPGCRRLLPKLRSHWGFRGWRAPSWPQGLPGHPMSLPKTSWVTRKRRHTAVCWGQREGDRALSPSHLTRILHSTCPVPGKTLGVLCESPRGQGRYGSVKFPGHRQLQQSCPQIK